MNKVFLAKVMDLNERDVVKYIEFNGFECDRYVGGLHIQGACFSGFEKKLGEVVENNFDEIETILTQDEFKKLFALDDELRKLGYGIKRDSKEYNRGMEIIKEYQEIIEKRLLSDENDKLFKKVIADEKEYCKQKYCLTDDEVNYIFENYGLDYQDRAIIDYVFDDIIDLVEEEKFQLGYDKVPYFDDKMFGEDLLDSEYYLELESGRIVSYNY